MPPQPRPPTSQNVHSQSLILSSSPIRAHARLYACPWLPNGSPAAVETAGCSAPTYTASFHFIAPGARGRACALLWRRWKLRRSCLRKAC